MLNVTNASFSEAILDGVPQIIWRTLPDGTVTFFNQRWFEFTGQDRQVDALPSWLEVVHPDDRLEAGTVWEKATRSAEKYENQFRLRSGSGSYRWVLAQAVPELDQGSVIGWCGTCTDIHEQVLATQALRSAEERLRKTVDHIPQMIWSTLPDGCHDYFSPSWYAFTGAPEGTTDGEGWNGMFHPDDQERAWTRWRRSLSTGEPYEIKYRLRHHSGEYRWVLGRALAEKDDQGQIIRWHGTCTDIHEQILAEQGMRQQRELLQTVIDSVSDLIFVKNRDSRFVLANKAMKEGCGDPVGKRAPQHLTDLAREHYEKSDQEVISTGMSSEFDGTVLMRGEERLFETIKVPWFDRGEIVGVIGVSRDVTDRRKAEAALRESEALHRSILEASEDCISLISLDGCSPASLPKERAGSFQGLISVLLQPYCDEASRRLQIIGDDVPVDDRGATPLSLTIHELATNSAKYGALSQSSGRVVVSITSTGDDVLMEWEEHGGPAIDGVPKRVGFGTELADIAVERQLGGTIRREWRKEGLLVTLTLAASRLWRGRDQPDV